MSDVFISYARSTEAQARRVAESLRALGYRVWRDDELPAHRAFADVIEERLGLAKAVVVIWSADAANSPWVRSEANRALRDGKLVQLRIDNHEPPMPFDQTHCADLSAWSGEPEAPEWRKVVASVAALTTGEPASGAASPLHVLPEPGERPPLARPDMPSVAVLPFRNLSGDQKQEYLADAISEDIVTSLSRWRWFFVIARGSSFTYKGRDIAPDRVGRELGVRYVLEGSIRKSGRRVRVTTQLVDTASDSIVWTDRFDQKLVDILELQDEITEQVVAAVEPAMLQRESVRIARKSLRDFSALDCFYRGMWYLNKMTEEADQEALSLFREVIRRDPDLSLGHIGLARTLFGVAVFDGSSQSMVDLAEARAAARIAIGLDPRDPWAYFASSGASLYLGDHGAALDEARTAIRLNPNFAPGHVRLGQVLTFSGRPDEAVAPLERGARLSPYDPQLWVILESLALAHYQARNYDQAIVNATAAMHQNHATASVILAASLAMKGRAREAADVLPRTRWKRSSAQRPMVASYADPASLEHLREGVRLARLALPS